MKLRVGVAILWRRAGVAAVAAAAGRSRERHLREALLSGHVARLWGPVRVSLLHTTPVRMDPVSSWLAVRAANLALVVALIGGRRSRRWFHRQSDEKKQKIYTYLGGASALSVLLILMNQWVHTEWNPVTERNQAFLFKNWRMSLAGAKLILPLISWEPKVAETLSLLLKETFLYDLREQQSKSVIRLLERGGVLADAYREFIEEWERDGVITPTSLEELYARGTPFTEKLNEEITRYLRLDRVEIFGNEEEEEAANEVELEKYLSLIKRAPDGRVIAPLLKNRTFYDNVSPNLITGEQRSKSVIQLLERGGVLADTHREFIEEWEKDGTLVDQR
ncbi:unnamed protein product [Notodromas monacha]|uniref:Uncharacterized protein n=1 Tax=Notodromas monacha TaxID=399045 RepID=A0A7R9C132_9CRUS|nr:unnamed protein product [Notodromas monacha]CAG0924367.1 unnamed protein product [Notodromas monacha]